MNYVITVFLWLSLIISTSISCTQQSAKEFKNEIKQEVQYTEEQRNLILSDNYKVAKKALDKAIAKRDEAMIRVALKKGSFVIKKDAIHAVKNAYFQTFVPDFVNSLEEIQKLTSEKTAEQQKIINALVSALVHLTGLKLPQNDEFSRDDIQIIITSVRVWYQTNEIEIREEYDAEIYEFSQVSPILSKNYRVAKWAFDDAVLKNDKQTIRKGLNAYSLPIKQNVVQAIKNLDDKSFVPDLIKILETNQGIMSGGSETQFEQRKLNKEIISTLAHLTGLGFTYVNDSSLFPCFIECPSKDIEKVLKESQEWWEQNKDQVKETKSN